MLQSAQVCLLADASLVQHPNGDCTQASSHVTAIGEAR